MHTFLQALILGILTGGVYALMSTGQTLVFGVMRVVNVAQGMLVILSAYLSYTVHQDLGIDPFLTLLIVMPVMFAVGVGIQLAFIRPVKRNAAEAGFEQTLLIMFALAVGIEGILDLVYTSEYRSITTSYANSSWTVGGYTLSVVRVLAFALAVVLLGALWLVLNKTGFGRAVRATVQNPTAARLLGVDTERIGALGMGLGVSLAGASGAVFGLIYAFNANSSYDLVSRLLSIIVLGGLGSVVGAVVGSVSLGVAEAVVAHGQPGLGAVHLPRRAHGRAAGAAAGHLRRGGTRCAVKRLAPRADSWLARVVIPLALLACVPFVMTTSWLLNLAVLGLMYAVLASSWNLLAGYTGYISLAHAAFFGIGAYSLALWTGPKRRHWAATAPSC